MTIISPLPYIFSNGAIADATQVDANLAQIVSDVNANAIDVNSYVAPTVKVLQDIGRTANGTITFPAKSVPLHIVMHETSGGTMNPAGISFVFGSGATLSANPPAPNNFSEIDSIIQNLTDGSFYSNSPVTVSISNSGGWGTASMDTFVYYVTLP